MLLLQLLGCMQLLHAGSPGAMLSVARRSHLLHGHDGLTHHGLLASKHRRQAATAGWCLQP
jgi:hypothetical protein